ncbi:MAG: hypothetical protein OHK0021_06390 [Bryobacter sp.]
MLNSRFSEILAELTETQACRHASLVTRAGSVVGLGRASNAANLSQHELQIAALAAAMASSGRELYRVLGEDEPEYMVFRGQQQTTLLSEMPGELLLVAVFPSAVEELVLQKAAEFVGERLLALQPAGVGGGLSPAALRDQSLRLLDELFTS